MTDYRDWKVEDLEWREGPVARIDLTDPDGNVIGTVEVPYDPDNKPSDDDLIAAAWRFYNISDYVDKQITDKDVQTLVHDLQNGAIGSWMRSLFEARIEGAKVRMSPEDDTPEEIEEAEATATFLTEVLRKERSEFVDAIFEAGDLWESMARTVLVHAWTTILEEVHDSYLDPLNIPDEEADAEILARFREGPYLLSSIMMLMPDWTQMTVEALIPENDTEEAIELAKAARSAVRRKAGKGTLALPELGLRWGEDGHGGITSHGIHRGVNQTLGRFPQWTVKSGSSPEHSINRYGVRGHLSISGGTALKIWEGVKLKAKQAKQYSDILPDVYLVVVATILTHRNRLDLFGNGHSYISIDAAMKDLGISKVDRKYNHEDIEKVRHAIHAIGDIAIRGVRTTYIEGGKKPVEVPFEGPIWRVMETVPKTRSQRDLEAFLSGKRGQFTNDEGTIPASAIAGFSLALGVGLDIGRDEIPHEARTMRAIMAYPPVHGRYKRRLGYSLSCEFRLRYQQQNWQQPYIVRSVLEDAPISIDERNPGRTYKLFHEALEALQNDQVIGTVRYPKAPNKQSPFNPGFDTGKKGWLDSWLDAKIVIMPPADVEATYRQSLGASNRRPKSTARPLKATG